MLIPKEQASLVLFIDMLKFFKMMSEQLLMWKSKI